MQTPATTVSGAAGTASLGPMPELWTLEPASHKASNYPGVIVHGLSIITWSISTFFVVDTANYQRPFSLRIVGPSNAITAKSMES